MWQKRSNSKQLDNKKLITVTKTFLPDIEEYNTHLKRAWDRSWLTNRGELVIELEDKIREELGLTNIILTNNGTIPIQIALKLFGHQGEVITTPFSYVATTASIIWENCTPVFVDIDEDHLTIDETKIEAAITPQTTAILATHVYGNPCNIEAIDKIAKKHDIKVIYDAAHCFGVRYQNESIFNFGDVSTCSFHATKIFHTGEGGAMFCKDPELYKKLYYSHNFGHDGPLKFHGLGINGKLSELQAALGLAMLPHMEHIFEERKKVVDFYNSRFEAENIKLLKIRKETEWNYSYYPIILSSEDKLLEIEKALLTNDIVSRRYFYPSLNNVPFVESVKMPVSERIASRVLCLPLYVGLMEHELELIVKIILDRHV